MGSNPKTNQSDEKPGVVPSSAPQGDGMISSKLEEKKLSQSIEQQVEDDAFLKTHLTSVLMRIAKEDPKLNLKGISARQVEMLAAQKGIELTGDEKDALKRLTKTLSAGGAATDQLAREWPAMIEQAETTRLGWGERFMKSFNKEPAKTLALIAGGAFVGWLGYKLIKGIVGMVKKEEGEKSISDRIFSARNVLGALGLTALGIFLGRDALKDFLYRKFGIAFTDEKMKELEEQLKKGQIPAQLAALEKLKGKVLDANGVKAAFGNSPIPQVVQDALKKDGFVTPEEIEKAKTAMKDALAGTAGEAKEKAEEGVWSWLGIRFEKNAELREEHTQFSNLIDKNNKSLGVPAYIFAQIGETPYSVFLEQSPSMLDRVGNIFEKYGKGEFDKLPKEMQEFYSQGKYRNLAEFFTTMLKDHGRQEEFKGKTITEVMRLIAANPTQYMDPEAVKKANEKNEYWQKVKSKVGQIFDPKIKKDDAFYTALFGDLTLAGAVMAMDTFNWAKVTIFSNAFGIITFTHEGTYNVMKYMADTLKKSDNGMMQAGGYYLHAAAYSVSIGAPLYMAKGFVSGYLHGGLMNGMANGLKGFVTGAKKGLAFPANAIKAITWDAALGEFKPIQSFEKIVDQNLHFLAEDLALNPFVRKHLPGIAPRGVLEKVLGGEKKVDERVMRRLENTMASLTEHEHAAAKRGKGFWRGKYYQDWAQNYDRAAEDIKEFMKELGWDGTLKKFTTSRKFEEVMAGFHLPEEANAVLRKATDRSLFVMLMDHKHPLNTYLKTLPPEKMTDIVRALDANKSLLEKIGQAPELINDPAVQTALKSFDPAKVEELEKVVTEKGKTVKPAREPKSKTGKAAAEASEAAEVAKANQFATQDLVKLAKLEDEAAIRDFLKTKNMPEELAAEVAPKLKGMSKIDDIKAALEGAAEAKGLKLGFSPEVSRLVKLGRVLGSAAAIGGTVLSGYEMVSAFREAAATTDAERQKVLLGKGGLYGMNMIADGAGAYVMIAGFAGQAVPGMVATVGAFAYPLIPLTYMGSSAIESMLEATKTREEWAQTDQEQLIHDWISTNGLGAGEAYRYFAGHPIDFVFKDLTNEKAVEGEKQTIRRNIVAVLLNREEGKAEKAPADPDRLHYIELITNYQPYPNYRQTVDLLRDSKTYASVMQTRRVRQGQEYTLAGLNVMDGRFENPDRKAAGELLGAIKKHALESINPALKQNFDAFSDRTLIDLFCESNSHMTDRSAEVTDSEIDFTNSLRAYLVHARGINTEKEYVKWSLKMGQKNKDELAAVNAKITVKIARFQENPAEVMKEDLARQSQEPGVRAVYALAQFFGYTGEIQEDALRGFFNEAHGGAFGLYYKNGNWYVNQAGRNVITSQIRDEKIGTVLSVANVEAMIHKMNSDPDNVIQTRQDSVVDIVSLHQFEEQVKDMAFLMERALKKPAPVLKDLKPAGPGMAPKEEGEKVEP